MTGNIGSQIGAIREKWNATTNVPADLAPWGFPGLTKENLSDVLGGLEVLAVELANIDDFEPDPVSNSFVIQTLTNLSQHASTHIPSNPQPHLPGFISLIEQLRTTLHGWGNESEKNSSRMVSGLTEKLAQSASRMEDAEKLVKEIREWHVEIAKKSNQIEEDTDAAVTAKTSIVADQKAVSDANNEASDLLVSAGKTVDEINELAQQITSLNETLEKNEKIQKKLFDDFESYRQQAENILADANRTGMAAAFITRKQELFWPLVIWGGVFAIALIGLFVLSTVFVIPSISAEKWQEAIYRLTLTGPFIWLGWFAAKQYGYTVRLREDYAYKVASAMSFEGYKREAEDLGKEMHAQLMETAIKNFSSNPLRIYEHKENHASPLHEIIERALKDEKITDLVKTFIAKVKL